MIIPALLVAVLSHSKPKGHKAAVPLVDFAVGAAVVTGAGFEVWSLEKSENIGVTPRVPLATPEPASLGILAIGLIGLCVRRKH